MHDDVAKRTDPALWERVKARVMRGAKGGRPGQWSARKAQLAVADYKKAGGGYPGPRSPRNSLARWTREEWGTKSGRKSGETGERYLPKAARDALSAADYAETTAKKRADTGRGEQFSRQPAGIARKTATARRAASEPQAAARASAVPEAAARAAGTAGKATTTPRTAQGLAAPRAPAPGHEPARRRASNTKAPTRSPMAGTAAPKPPRRQAKRTGKAGR